MSRLFFVLILKVLSCFFKKKTLDLVEIKRIIKDDQARKR